MKDKVIEKFLEEVWGRWCSVPVALFASFLVCAYFVSALYSGEVKYLMLVAFIGIDVWYIWFVYSHNSIPKAMRGKIGIILFIDSPDKKTYEDTKRKFGDELSENLISSFDLIFAPFGIKPIKNIDEKIVEFLKRRKSILFLKIRINADEDGNLLNYDMNIKGAIIHPKFIPDVENAFSYIFGSTFKAFQRVAFSSKDMIHKMEVTAKSVSVACEYIIGLSLFLSCNYDKAEIILNNLQTKIVNMSEWTSMYKSIRVIRFTMFFDKAGYFVEQYEKIDSDDEMLEKMNQYLEKANACIPNTPSYHLCKAYYCVAHDDDVKSAKDHINICKQGKDAPKEWMYSEAFIYAYENRSIHKIYTAYRQAFQVEYNIQNLIVFIDKILSKQPKRIGLCLALGILYNQVDDKVLSKEYIDRYLSGSNNREEIRQQLTRKQLL